MKLNKTTAQTILRTLLLIRHTEEQIAERYSQQEMRCPTHLCIGQEGVASAVGAALTHYDLAVSTHRAHGHYLAKGGNLKAMLAEIYGKATGCGKGKAGSMHLLDQAVGFMGSTAIVGGTIPLGVGLGLALKLQKKPHLAVVFIGDGSIEEGVFYEAVNFAALKHLPVLFICENNLYSVYSPLKVRQPKGRSIQQMVAAMGIPGACGDGNKPEEVFSIVDQAAKSIRKGQGPQFLEFSTYRWREHCGPNFDNHLGYRTIEEYESWKAQDPVPYFKRFVVAEGLIKESEIQQLEGQIQTEVDSAFEFAKNSPFPEGDETFTSLFAKSEHP